MARFPKTIYVTREKSDGEEWLTAHDSVPDVDETTPCATYQLVRMGKVEVTRSLT